MNTTYTVATFPLGRIVITRGALNELDREIVQHSLYRHMAGDWGDLDEHDWKMNNAALKEGGRLFSRYRFGEEKHFFIITESDRSATTILLPDEY